MKITYYRINDLYDLRPISGAFAGKNYSSVEKIRAAILDNYKFAPNLYLDHSSFKYLIVQKPGVVYDDQYKVYKSGPNKDQFVLDEEGKPVVVSRTERNVMETVADYSEYGCWEGEFLTIRVDGRYKGYYRLHFVHTEPVINSDNIEYRAQVFISFITAKKVITPEVKTPGLPYQAAETKIEVGEESARYPLRVCNVGGKNYYGLAASFDYWNRTRDYFVVQQIYWKEEELIIED